VAFSSVDANPRNRSHFRGLTAKVLHLSSGIDSASLAWVSLGKDSLNLTLGMVADMFSKRNERNGGGTEGEGGRE
jgi:hypothetical protein